jgi:phosphatidylglycerophosphatase A
VNAATWIGSGLGLGLSPVMPGTCGTLLGVAVALGAMHAPWPSLAFGALAALFALGGLPFAARAMVLSGRPDPGWFVLDEVAGYLLTLVALPVASRPVTVLALAFVAFRVFDMAKPWPVRPAERLPGAWGIMADDLVAAVLAHVTVRLALWVL